MKYMQKFKNGVFFVKCLNFCENFFSTLKYGCLKEITGPWFSEGDCGREIYTRKRAPANHGVAPALRAAPWDSAHRPLRPAAPVEAHISGRRGHGPGTAAAHGVRPPAGAVSPPLGGALLQRPL